MVDNGVRMMSHPGDGGGPGGMLSAASSLNSSSSAGSTQASDNQGCKNGALMDSFGIFLQGLLGVVAFSTLMCEYYVAEPLLFDFAGTGWLALNLLLWTKQLYLLMNSQALISFICMHSK